MKNNKINNKSKNELSKYDIFEFMIRPYNESITRIDNDFFIEARDKESSISGHLKISECEIEHKNEAFYRDYFQHENKIYNRLKHVEFTPKKVEYITLNEE